MKKMIIQYSLFQRKITKKLSIGFAAYIFDTETESKTYPSYNGYKLSEYGVLKPNEFTKIQDYYLENRKSNFKPSLKAFTEKDFKDTLTNPTDFLTGFFRPSKERQGPYEIRFINEGFDYLNEKYPDVDEIYLSTPNIIIEKALSRIIDKEVMDVSEIDMTCEGLISDAIKESKKLKLIPFATMPTTFVELAAWSNEIFTPDTKTNIVVNDELDGSKVKVSDPHPFFINGKLSYFHNKSVENDKPYYSYATSRYDKDFTYIQDGSPYSGYGVGVFRLKEPEQSIETIKKIHNNSITEKRLGMSAIVNLQSLFNKKFLTTLLSNPENPPVYSHRVTEMNPVVTYKSTGETIVLDSYRIIRKKDSEEMISAMEELLDNVVTGKGKGEVFDTVDITDVFYETDEVKKKKVIIKKHSTSTTIDVPKDKTRVFSKKKVRLKVGYDIPIYRVLNKLTGINTEVQLVLYDKTKTPDGLKFERYAVFIKSGEEVSLWSSVYSNHLFSFLSKEV